MALSLDPIIGRPVSRIDAYIRPIALALLMVAEILALTIRFDPPRALSTDLWWGLPLVHAHSIIKFLLLATVSVIAFGGVRLLHRLRRAYFQNVDSDYPWPKWFLAHGLSLLVMTGLTSAVCERNALESSHSNAWITFWVASVVATVGTWLATMISPAALGEVLKRSQRSLTVGLTVASLAYFLGSCTGLLWNTMAGATLVVVRSILSLFSNQVTCNPAERTIAIGDFRVNIGDPCSGYEGIGLVVAFLGGYFWFFRRSLRWPQANYLIALGALLIWLLNAVRIALLVMIGAWASPAVAQGGFHSQAGWLSFLGVSLGLVAISRRSSFFAADPGALEVSRRSNPSMAFLGPFLAVLATSLATAALSSGFDALYGLRAVAGGMALWYFRREFAALISNGTWVGVAIGVIAFGLWVALEPASTGAGRALASTVEALPSGRGWAWIALRVIGSVAIVPIVEELAFRGYLIRRIRSSDFQSIPFDRFSWLALLVSSAAFGLLHGRWLAGMLVGVLYGLALYRRGKLGDAVVAHAVTNTLIAATVLSTGDWSMWT